MPLLRFLLLPFRAPLVLLLFAVATVMGNHWTVFQAELMQNKGLDPHLYWAVELVQALVVVIICTMPDLLLRQISMVMASWILLYRMKKPILRITSTSQESLLWFLEVVLESQQLLLSLKGLMKMPN